MLFNIISTRLFKTIVISAFILAIFSFLLISVINLVNRKNKAINSLKDLSKFNLVDLDSSIYKLNKSGTCILIYFDPNCEHCSELAQSFLNRVNDYKNVKIVWISSENICEIDNFSIQTRLNKYEEFVFTKIKSELVYDTFGSVIIPQIYIYKDGNLTKQFKGATPSEEIIKYL